MEQHDYPIVYATEPGFMDLSDKDVAALHDYLLKGGFIIFDDFRGPYDWQNLPIRCSGCCPAST